MYEPQFPSLIFTLPFFPLDFTVQDNNSQLNLSLADRSSHSNQSARVCVRVCVYVCVYFHI